MRRVEGRFRARCKRAPPSWRRGMDCSGCEAFVPVMQTPDLRYCHDWSRRHGLGGSSNRRVPAGRQMSSRPLVVCEIRLPDFPQGIWSTYALWQFSSEVNCHIGQEGACAYSVPGTEHDMDINVCHGSVDEVKKTWPLIQSQRWNESKTAYPK